MGMGKYQPNVPQSFSCHLKSKVLEMNLPTKESFVVVREIAHRNAAGTVVGYTIFDKRGLGVRLSAQEYKRMKGERALLIDSDRIVCDVQHLLWKYEYDRNTSAAIFLMGVGLGFGIAFVYSKSAKNKQTRRHRKQ